MFVVGTAGHVDHGKSTLISSLTGINPDRLKEEQERQMTIDLGFAWFTLPTGEEIGIVDVPGHRDFIENMLSGATGIDAVMFIVAADEGVMPQTREHLDILKLLSVEKGIVVITKIDLAEDEDWIDLIESDIRNLTAGSFLEDAPFVRFSAISGEGISELTEALMAVLESTPSRIDKGKPRLPIDRIFTLKGYGTVVTGTLRDGGFTTGDLIVIQPQGLDSRIRSIQNHKRQIDRALPGSRTALNLPGVDTEDIKRGAVVCLPETYFPTTIFDAKIKLLDHNSGPLKHDDEVKIFIGSGQVLGRARVIGVKEIFPGESGWVQFMLSEPVLIAEKDNLIVRRPSPSATIGGGLVVDPHPKGRHKRFSEKILNRFKSLADGSEKDKVILTLNENRIIQMSNFIEKINLDVQLDDNLIHSLIVSGDIVLLSEEDNPKDGKWIIAKNSLSDLKKEINSLTSAYHDKHPLRIGIPFEECRRALNLSREQLTAFLNFLNNKDQLRFDGFFVYLPEFSVQFSSIQQEKINELNQVFNANENQPPLENACKEIVGEDLYYSLIQMGELVKLTESIVFQQERLKHILSSTMQLLKEKQTITIAEFRDRFSTSRKYAIAILEHFDSLGVTRRDGDFRRLK